MSNELKDVMRSFRMISLPDCEIIGRALRERDSYSCELSFPNLFMYAPGSGMQMAVADGVVLLLNRGDKCLHFPPGAFPEPDFLAEAARVARELGLTEGTVYDVPDEYLAAHPDLETLFEICSDPGEFDYLYATDRLVEMNGAKLRKKRNLVRQFEEANPHFQAEAISPSNRSTAALLAREYNRRMNFAPFLAVEERAMEMAWQHFDELSLDGIILYDEDRAPVGFSVWSLLNRRVADVHFEKADHESKGASQMLTYQAALRMREHGVAYMNREQDMGNPGLRQAKHSLDPEFLYRRNTLVAR